ncbi:hypothetical protein K440DRAFT_610567 [Wilcoxina mikolae CBS 423.85]|nr:hypothetical protein K440DRAFT_610567 [Wilcoxina mikolae CBS 423.85]
MDSVSEFTIPLIPMGDDRAAFRLQNSPGELQRPHIVQRDISDLTVQADLFSVMHGSDTPGGLPATLVVIDFRFLGSHSDGRRFRKAIIDICFARENEQAGNEFDPVVCQIAPYGTFAMNPSIQQQETTLSTTTSANTGLGLSTLGICAGFERKTTTEREKCTMLFGSRRIQGRTHGLKNSARWMLLENDFDRRGIPSLLRTAILINPRTSGKFRALVTIKADVNMVYSALSNIESLLGKAVVDPVCFGDESTRTPLGPELRDVDIQNMSACNLDTIGRVEDQADDSQSASDSLRRSRETFES